MSDVFAMYGIPSGFALTYRNYVRLYANADRQLARLAFAHAWGSKDGPEGDFPRAWADAIARDPAEAEEIEYTTNTARREWRVMRKKGWL